MGKRNKIIKLTSESEALKALRLKNDLSVRKLADLMEISKTRVHQMETGRDNISEGYIGKFLDSIGLTWVDWKFQIGYGKKGGKTEFCDLREKCHEILDLVELSKLELVHGLLLNFSN